MAGLSAQEYESDRTGSRCSRARALGLWRPLFFERLARRTSSRTDGIPHLTQLARLAGRRRARDRGRAEPDGRGHLRGVARRPRRRGEPARLRPAPRRGRRSTPARGTPGASTSGRTKDDRRTRTSSRRTGGRGRGGDGALRPEPALRRRARRHRRDARRVRARAAGARCASASSRGCRGRASWESADGVRRDGVVQGARGGDRSSARTRTSDRRESTRSWGRRCAAASACSGPRTSSMALNEGRVHALVIEEDFDAHRLALRQLRRARRERRVGGDRARSAAASCARCATSARRSSRGRSPTAAGVEVVAAREQAPQLPGRRRVPPADRAERAARREPAVPDRAGANR